MVGSYISCYICFTKLKLFLDFLVTCHVIILLKFGKLVANFNFRWLETVSSTFQDLVMAFDTMILTSTDIEWV